MARTAAADTTVHDGLARSTAQDHAIAWHHREALVAAAASLAAAAGHDPDRARCEEAGCGLPDRSLCDVVHRLAGLPGAPAVVATDPVAPALERFTGALVLAADAIRHCRQHEHAGRTCWFSSDGRGDGCGAVLRLLHALG